MVLTFERGLQLIIRAAFLVKEKPAKLRRVKEQPKLAFSVNSLSPLRRPHSQPQFGRAVARYAVALGEDS